MIIIRLKDQNIFNLTKHFTPFLGSKTLVLTKDTRHIHAIQNDIQTFFTSTTAGHTFNN